MIFLTLPPSPKRLGSSIQELDSKDIHFIHVEKKLFYYLANGYCQTTFVVCSLK